MKYPIKSSSTLPSLGDDLMDFTFDPYEARAAARRLQPHLPPPSAAEWLAGDDFHDVDFPLLQPGSIPRVIPGPGVVFDALPDLGARLPGPWEEAYLHWGRRQQRARQLRQWLTCGGAPEEPVRDSLLAGMLCYVSGGPAQPAAWRDEAVKTAGGAWLAAAALPPATAKPWLLPALRASSRYLWWISQNAAVDLPTKQAALAHLDLPAALLLAAQAPPVVFQSWLVRLARAGLNEPAAAAAALVLLPEVDAGLQHRWRATVQAPRAERWAYETVRWSRHTWPVAEWTRLKAALRSAAVRDRGRWAFHWFRDLESPESAGRALAQPGWDPLWAAELLAALPVAVDTVTFRFRLGEQLGTPNQAAAGQLLTWLDQRGPGPARP